MAVTIRLLTVALKARLFKIRRRLKLFALFAVGVLWLRLLVFDTWGQAFGAVGLGWLLYVFVRSLIVDGIRRWAWPLSQRQDDLYPAPFVPAPRVWSFQVWWSAPFAQRLATARGFAPREWDDTPRFFTSQAKGLGRVLTSLKIEEYAYRLRAHQWTVPLSNRDHPTSYTWKDYTKFRSGSLETLWHLDIADSDSATRARGWCQLWLSLRFTEAERGCLIPYLMFSVNWENERQDSSGNDLIFEVPLDEARHERVGSSHPYKSGEWDWDWTLDVC